MMPCVHKVYGVMTILISCSTKKTILHLLKMHCIMGKMESVENHTGLIVLISQAIGKNN